MWPHCMWDMLQGHPAFWVKEVRDSPLKLLMDSPKTDLGGALGFLGKGSTSVQGHPPCIVVLYCPMWQWEQLNHFYILLEMLLFL